MLRHDNRMNVQAVGERNLRAIADVSGAMPILLPGMPEAVDIASLLSIVDGVLLCGGRANVHPARFGMDAHPRHEPYDEGRDGVALSLARACVEEGFRCSASAAACRKSTSPSAARCIRKSPNFRGA